MNITVAHPVTSPRRTAPNSSNNLRGTGKRGSMVQLPSIEKASGNFASPPAAPKMNADQKREQRESEMILEESLWHLCGANAEETLEKLLNVVAIRRCGPIALRKGKPLWQRVQDIVAMANQEGVRRVHMAMPREEVQFFFDKSLNMLGVPSTETSVGKAEEFAMFSSLRMHLIGATLNNKAFYQYTEGEPFAEIAQTLLEAFKVEKVAFLTSTLYNLAVTMVGLQRYDLACNFIVCCSKLVEVCLNIDVSRFGEASQLYTQFCTNVAKHAIMCHHLIAALAAWSKLHDLEVYHCQLAVCCAQKYLDTKSIFAIRCSQRLVAAKDGNSALMMSEKEPPRLPMLTDDFLLVMDPLFVVFMERMEAVQPPSCLAGCLHNLKSKRKSPVRRQSGNLPKIKVKQQHSTPLKREATSLARRSPLHPRSVASSRGRGESRLSKKSSTLRFISTMMESFKRERSVLSSVNETVFYLGSSEEIGTPPKITLIPEPAFYCYKHLRKELRHLIRELGPHVSYAETNTTAVEQTETLSVRESIISERGLTSPRLKKYMHITNTKLRRLSLLTPDMRFGAMRLAIVMIQSYWRRKMARRIYDQRRRDVKETILMREAAETIQRAFRDHLATLPCIRIKKALKEHCICVQRLTLIQRYLYEKQSLEEMRVRYVATCRRLVAEIIENRRRNAAAIRLQAFWRMFREWIRLRQLLRACVDIQRVWRGHQGRLKAREARVYRRLEEQRRKEELKRRIRPIQIWWKKFLAVRAGKAIVTRRQRDVLAYLEKQEMAFNKEWERIKHIPNFGILSMKMLSVLRGFCCRVKLAHQRRLIFVLKRFLLRIALMKREQCRVQKLREEWLQNRALRRRGEEVADAALRIQSAVRRWLARRLRRVLSLQLQVLHQQARIVQYAYRRHVGRRLLEALKLEVRLQEEKRMMAQLMHYSASKIQATWRMYSERYLHTDYMQFLRRDRHVFASRIQKAWSAYKARYEACWLELCREESHRSIQEDQLCKTAVLRIQSAARMFLVRQKLTREGVILRPTPACLNRSARIIQCAWRRYAAYEYVQQLRFSRAYYDQQKVNMESLHTYATMIQSLVRAKILNPQCVSQRRLDLERERIDHWIKRGEMQHVTCAVITIQKNMRGASLRSSSLLQDISTLVETDECVTASALHDAKDFGIETHQRKPGDAEHVSPTAAEGDEPVSPTAAERAEPVSPAAAEGAEPVSSAAAEEAEPVSPSAAEGDEPVSPTAAERAEPVSPAAAEGAEPVSPTAAERAEPVSPSAAEEAEPVSPTAAEGAEPVSPAAAEGAEPVSPTAAEGDEPVSPTAAERAEPVSPTAAEGAEPVSPTAAERAEPVSPTPAEGAEPVSPTAAEGAEPVSPTAAERAEPVSPAAAERAEPVSPAAAEGAEPVSSAAAEGAEPVSPTAAEGDEPVSSAAAEGAEPVSPTAAEGDEPVSPTAAERAEPVSPTPAEGAEPVSPTAAEGAEPVSPAAAEGDEPVSPAAAERAEPVSPTAAERAEPVSPTAAEGDEPVSPTAAEGDEPVSPTPAERAEPVSPTAAEGDEPVSPTPAERAEPVSPTAAEGDEPVSSAAAEGAEPVSPAAAGGAEPVSPTAAEGDEPVSSAAAEGAEPVSPTAAEGDEPVSPTAAEGAEPVSPAAAEGAEPVSPAAAEGVEPVSPTAAEGVEPVSPTAAEGVEPVSPTAAERAEPVSPTAAEGAEPVSPTAAEGDEPVSPTAAERAEPVSPTPAEGDEPVSPTAAEGAEPVSPTAAEGAEPVSSAAAEGDEPVSPAAAERAEPVSPTAAERAEPVSPTAAEGAESVSPTAAEGAEPVSPTAAGGDEPVSPTAAEGAEPVSPTAAEGAERVDTGEKCECFAKKFTPLFQRCGRGAVVRREMFAALRGSPRWKAAVEVQRIWRGWSARQLVEVYYEFYQEEVEVTDGDDDIDGNKKR